METVEDGKMPIVKACVQVVTPPDARTLASDWLRRVSSTLQPPVFGVAEETLDSFRDFSPPAGEFGTDRERWDRSRVQQHANLPQKCFGKSQ